MKKIYAVLFVMGISIPSLAEVLEEGSIPEFIKQEEMPAPEGEPQNLVIPMGYEGEEDVSAPNEVVPMGKENHPKPVSTMTSSDYSEDIVTVRQVSNMPNGANVIMVGEIISHKSGTDYLFRDTTGAVDVKISTKIWGDLRVYETDQLKIIGYIDKNYVDGIKIIVTKIEAEY